MKGSEIPMLPFSHASTQASMLAPGTSGVQRDCMQAQ
jgi:hypothetical protein